MQILVVSSPGSGPGLHWSTAAAQRFVELAVEHRAVVHWLCALPEDATPPVAPSGVAFAPFRHRSWPLPRVERSQLDPELERALTRHLRACPTAAVLHLGLGARGSPNVTWLADRLGSPAFAALHGRELVCHRGDLVDRDGQPCLDWSDPDRCRWCCTSGRSRRPRGDEFRNRIDLFIAGLSTCEAVLVPTAADVGIVTALGVDAGRVVVAAEARQLWLAMQRQLSR